MPAASLRLLSGLLLGLLLSACGPSGQQEQAAATQAQNARAAHDLTLYQAMREQGKYELAAPIGEGIVARAPDSEAAASVRETLADSQHKADAINEKRRLAGLWLYQSGEQSGGQQNTATLYPSRPGPYHDRIKLILRRHSDWGQSVYLYDSDDQGFVCQGSCKLALTVDGKKAKPLDASLPPTGEPALFIDSGKRLLKLMESARDLTITADIKGAGKQNLYFEVGGFDPARWTKPATDGAR